MIPRVLVRRAHPTRPIQEGETLSLVCEAYGLPTPEVTWLQMGSPVSNMFADNPRHTIETTAVEEFFVMSVLNVSNVVPGLDEGEYKCRVDNFNISNQQVAASINISILGEPIRVHLFMRLLHGMMCVLCSWYQLNLLVNTYS